MIPLAERRILHVLPHPGEGGEGYVAMVSAIEGIAAETAYLAEERRPLRAAPRIAARMPALRRRTRDFDLVHVHGDTGAILSLPLLRRRPAVVTTHGLHLLRRLPAARLGVRAAVAAARAVICTSPSERREVEALARPADREKLVTVENGIVPPPPAGAGEGRALREELGIGPGETIALYLGQLEPHKDPLAAVAAAERARAVGAALALLVAGDGPLRADVEAAAGPATRVLGFRSDVPVLLAAADVFVLTSHREGLSLAALEAMSHGVCALVSDGPGNPDAVGDAGIVVPVGDVAGLAAALTRLAAHPEERERLGALGRNRVRERFSVERMLEETLRVYECAIREG